MKKNKHLAVSEIIDLAIFGDLIRNNIHPDKLLNDIGPIHDKHLK
jgi:hypothetical protein